MWFWIKYYLIRFIILLLLLQGVSYLISEVKRKLWREERSPFECGFEISRRVRIPFSFSYFILTLIFLLFDLEIIYLIFIPIRIIYIFPLCSKLIFILFFFILVLGLLYEWTLGSLEWCSCNLIRVQAFQACCVGESPLWINIKLIKKLINTALML